MDHGAAILAELQAIRLQNDRMLALLLAKKPRKPRRAVEDDDALLVMMLPIIAAGIGKNGREFTTSEALVFIQFNDARLFAHIHRALGSEGHDVHKRLAAILGRAVGRQVGGLKIHRIGKDDNRVMWRAILVSSAPETTQTNLAA